MLEIKMQSFSYRISLPNNKFEQVNGFALDIGLPIQACVRQLDRFWRCDDFLTGHSLVRTSEYGESLIGFITRRHAFLKERIESGAYQKALEKAQKVNL